MAQFKRGKRGALAVVFSVAACAALVFGVTQSFAGGKSAVAPIRYDRDACSTPSNNKVIGKASFTRSGNTVTLKVQLHGADPGDYYLYLYFNSCSDSGYYAKFKVDASGEGSRSLTATVPSTAKFFFADAYNNTTATDNESDFVQL